MTQPGLILAPFTRADLDAVKPVTGSIAFAVDPAQPDFEGMLYYRLARAPR